MLAPDCGDVVDADGSIERWSRRHDDIRLTS
jgi:hypothetical protein